jgi:hypothetical protein
MKKGTGSDTLFAYLQREFGIGPEQQPISASLVSGVENHTMIGGMPTVPMPQQVNEQRLEFDSGKGKVYVTVNKVGPSNTWPWTVTTE